MAPRTDPETRWNVAVPLPDDEELPTGLVRALSKNPPLNVSRMLAGTLDMYPAATGLVKAIFDAENIDIKLREIIALRAAQILDCRYEWEANVILAKNAKITDDQITSIGVQGPVTGLDKDGNLLCRSTDEITLYGAISDDALAAMLDRFGATLTNKFILIISWFNLLSRYLLSTRVPLEKSNKLDGKTSPV